MAAIYQIGVAALIRNRRAELGLSQGELEAMSGVRKSLLSNYEAGRVKLPDLDQRLAISEALRIPHVDFFLAAGELRPEDVEGMRTRPTSIPEDDPRHRLSELALALSPKEAENLLSVVSVWGSPGRGR